MVSARTSQLRQAVTNCSHNNPSSPPSAGPNEGAIRGELMFNLEENTQTGTGQYCYTKPAGASVQESMHSTHRPKKNPFQQVVYFGIKFFRFIRKKKLEKHLLLYTETATEKIVLFVRFNCWIDGYNI